MKDDSHLHAEYERLRMKYEMLVDLLKRLQFKKYFSDLDRRAINETLAKIAKA